MKILSVALLLEIAVFVYAETCPENEKMIPCVCTEQSQYIEVDCSGDEMKKLTLEDLKSPLRSLSGKENVRILLSGIKLDKVPSKLFQGIGVNRLIIRNCDLDSLADSGEKVLIGLEDSLDFLGIHNSFDEDDDLTELELGHLRKLKNFHLSWNSIKQLSKNLFNKGPASLERVLIHSNGIEKLDDKAFADLSKLKFLMLKENIDTLERSMLPSSADHLTNLNLQNNNLGTLPGDIFRDMPQLRIVSLDNNRITKLDRMTWEPVWEQLDSVNIEENPLVCDTHMNWMFDLRNPSSIQGTCAAPEAKKGTSLKEFIHNKGQ